MKVFVSKPDGTLETVVDSAQTVTVKRRLWKPDILTMVTSTQGVPSDLGDGWHLTILGGLHGPAKRFTVEQVERAAGEESRITDSWKITARSVDGMADDRLIMPPSGESHDEQRDVPAETAMKHYVDSHLGPSAATARQIPNLEIETDQGRGLTVTTAGRYMFVGEMLESIGKKAGVGFETVYDLDQQVSQFETVHGADNTAKVFFDVGFNSIVGQSWLRSVLDEKTWAIVAGQGEGTERETVTRFEGASEPEGFDRREAFVDARDVEQGDTSLLESRGDDALAGAGEEDSFELDVAMVGPFVYREDFDLGDTVTVRNARWNLERTGRIVQSETVYTPTSVGVKVQVGRPWPTLKDRVKSSAGGGSGNVAVDYPTGEHDHDGTYALDSDDHHMLGTDEFLPGDAGDLYPDGVTVFATTDDGWPHGNGVVFTFKSGNFRVAQRFQRANGTDTWIRGWSQSSDQWDDWLKISDASHDHDADYVNASGDTMAGALDVNLDGSAATPAFTVQGEFGFYKVQDGYFGVSINGAREYTFNGLTFYPESEPSLGASSKPFGEAHFSGVVNTGGGEVSGELNVNIDGSAATPAFSVQSEFGFYKVSSGYHAVSIDGARSYTFHADYFYPENAPECGISSKPFGDAHFSGVVNAGGLDVTGTSNFYAGLNMQDTGGDTSYRIRSHGSSGESLDQYMIGQDRMIWRMYGSDGKDDTWFDLRRDLTTPRWRLNAADARFEQDVLVVGNFDVQGTKNAQVPDPDDDTKAYRFAAVEFDTPGTLGTTVRDVEVDSTREERIPLPEHFTRIGTSPMVFVTYAGEPTGDSPLAPWAFVEGWDEGTPEVVLKGPAGTYHLLIIFTRADAGADGWGHTVDVEPDPAEPSSS